MTLIQNFMCITTSISFDCNKIGKIEYFICIDSVKVEGGGWNSLD